MVVGWIMGLPMDLNFKLFETATLIMTVLVVAFMLQVRYLTFFLESNLVFQLIHIDAYICRKGHQITSKG